MEDAGQVPRLEVHMTHKPTDELDEAALASLLGELREPPRAWIEAAKELPRARAEISGIVERAQADIGFRQQVLDNLEDALRAEGHEPSPQLVAALRSGIDAG